MRNYTADPTGASPVYVAVGTGGASFHESLRPDCLSWWPSTALRVTYRPNIDGGLVRDETWILRPERLA